MSEVWGLEAEDSTLANLSDVCRSQLSKVISQAAAGAGAGVGVGLEQSPTSSGAIYTLPFTSWASIIIFSLFFLCLLSSTHIASALPLADYVSISFDILWALQSCSEMS